MIVVDDIMCVIFKLKFVMIVGMDIVVSCLEIVVRGIFIVIFGKKYVIINFYNKDIFYILLVWFVFEFFWWIVVGYKFRRNF